MECNRSTRLDTEINISYTTDTGPLKQIFPNRAMEFINTWLATYFVKIAAQISLSVVAMGRCCKHRGVPNSAFGLMFTNVRNNGCIPFKDFYY